MVILEINEFTTAIYKSITIREILIRIWKGQATSTIFSALINDFTIVMDWLYLIDQVLLVMHKIASQSIFAICFFGKSVTRLCLVRILTNFASQFLNSMGELTFISIRAKPILRVVLAQGTFCFWMFLVFLFRAQLEMQGIGVITISWGLRYGIIGTLLVV